MVYAGTMGFILSIGGFFFILILGAVTLSIANTITIGIIERTKEIGTLRAIGYEPNHLTSLFIKENLIISTLCVAVGLLFLRESPTPSTPRELCFDRPAFPGTFPLWSFLSCGFHVLSPSPSYF